MHAPESLQITPMLVIQGDSPQVSDLKQKVNELIKKLEEAYRYLHMDVRIIDFREKPPHYSTSHSRWKFYENPTTGDLELWHRSEDTWSKTYWEVRGDLTWPTHSLER